MTDISDFTGKFKASAAKVSKRPRPSHVCVQCRNNKLRCDRAKPSCGSCRRRGIPDGCSYGTQDSRPGLVNHMEYRLAHLEDTIKRLMASQTSDQTLPSTNGEEQLLALPVSDQVNENTKCQAENGLNSLYVGNTHWSAMLEDLNDLRAAIQETLVDDLVLVQSSQLGGDASLIFGGSTEYSTLDIVSHSLPPKDEVDRLIAVYFNSETYIIPFIHRDQFQRQYNHFWADTTSVNPLWLAQLFCICYLATGIAHSTGSYASIWKYAADARSTFHTAAGQALITGQYSRPQKFGPEALCIYAQCSNMRSLDPSRQAAAILTVAVRMAYEMGYHRDPDTLPGSFSAFVGEMRRRLWSTCKQMDLMISFQFGLPSNINLEQCDTKSPKNLLDSDFAEDTRILPPSRSLEEATPILWFIVKDQQIAHFSKVWQGALSCKNISQTQIADLDGQIRHLQTSIPEVLRVKPLVECLAESPFFIMTRIYINFIHLKSICVLHRRSMARGDLHSTELCVEAAINIVETFLEMFGEFSPGGRLHLQRWMLSNITMNDFLLGLMILCLHMNLEKKRMVDGVPLTSIRVVEVQRLLEQSQAICVDKSQESRDAGRVSQAIKLTLEGSKTPNFNEKKSESERSYNESLPGYGDPYMFNIPTISTPIGLALNNDPMFGSLDPFRFFDYDSPEIDMTNGDSDQLLS